MLTRIGEIAVLAELTEGTENVPTSAACILPAGDVTLARKTSITDNPALSGYPDPLAPVIGQKLADLTLPVYVKGSGAAGTVPPVLDDLLKSAGMILNTVTAERNEYTLNSLLDPTLDMPVSAKRWHGTGFRRERGIRNNLVLTLEAGKQGIAAFAGSGVFTAEGDEATPAAPADIPKAPIVQSASAYLLEHRAAAYDSLNGSLVKMGSAASTALKYAFKIPIRAGDAQVARVCLNLIKNGTPSGETLGVWCTIETEQTSAPSGTPLTGGTSVAIATANISATANWYDFLFTNPPTLTGGVQYWIAVHGDYTPADPNNIELDTMTCLVGGQLSMVYGVAWAACSLYNISVRILDAPVGGTRLLIGKAELNLNNGIIMEQDLGADNGVLCGRITTRKPVLTLDPLKMNVAVRDLWNSLLDGRDLWFGCDVGSTAGNIYKLRLAHCTVQSDTEPGDRSGEITQPVELLLRNPGDFALIFK